MPSRVKYNKADVESAARAALKLAEATGKNYYVWATAYGFVVKPRNPEILGQVFLEITPSGRIFEHMPNFQTGKYETKQVGGPREHAIGMGGLGGSKKKRAKITLYDFHKKYPVAVDAVAYFFRSNKDDDNQFLMLANEVYERLPRGVAEEIHVKTSEFLLDIEFFVAGLLPAKDYYHQPLEGDEDEIMDFEDRLAQLEDMINKLLGV